MNNTRKLLALSFIVYISSVLLANPSFLVLENAMDAKEIFAAFLIYVTPWAYYWWSSKDPVNIAENIFSIVSLFLSVIFYVSVSPATIDVRAFAILIQGALLYGTFIGALLLEVIAKKIMRNP